MFVVLSVSLAIIGYAQAASVSHQSLLVESNGKMMRKEAEANSHLQKSAAAERAPDEIEDDDDADASEEGSDTYRGWDFTKGVAPNKFVPRTPKADIFDYAGTECKKKGANEEWNHYHLDSKPMTFRHCSNTCRKVLECIGFDWDEDGCRLFTQKAVDVRRWTVLFDRSHGGPLGNGSYVRDTSDLGEIKEELDKQTELKGCHLRKNALVSDAFYRLVGHGRCERKNSTKELKHYTASVASYHACEDACNKVDECIAVSFAGHGIHEETATGADEATGTTGVETSLLSVTSGNCKLYVQKEIAIEHFHGLAEVTLSEDGEFASDTHMIEAFNSTDSDDDDDDNCSVKREYYSADDYYIKLDSSGLCQSWNHYQADTDNPKNCEARCDKLVECVGFDFDGQHCRLFTSKESSDLTLVPGTAPYDMFPGDPDKLALGEEHADTGDGAAFVDPTTADATHTDGSHSSHGCYKKSRAQTWDDFEYVGNNRCNGGGYWNYYQLCLPDDEDATYADCSKACHEKDACVGFDSGQGLCFLYTQYAVGEGSWPDVCMDNGAPFMGSKVTNLSIHTYLFMSKGYPKHNELSTNYDEHHGNPRNESDDNRFHCYKKKNAPAREARYIEIGKGTCSLGGYWPRYPLVPGNDAMHLINLTRDESCAVCQNACNIKDECVGFDCGSWKIDDESAQLWTDRVVSREEIFFGCNMYAAKPTWNWKKVAAERSGEHPKPLQGTDDHADIYPHDPRLLLAESGRSDHYEAELEDGESDLYCYQKNAWVPLTGYYIHLPLRKCTTYPHYIFNGTDEDGHPLQGEQLVEECQEKCDMWVSCIGIDVDESHQCRLFVTRGITGDWNGVYHNNNQSFPGNSSESGVAANFFALSGNKLSRRLSHVAAVAGDCYIKSHWHPNKEQLDDGETR